MFGLTEKLVDDRALVVGFLAGNLWDGDTGRRLKVKELLLLRTEEDPLLLGIILCLLLGDSLVLGVWLLVSWLLFIGLWI